MITKDGRRFDIHGSGNLYYLPTVEQNVDNVKLFIKCKHGMKLWVVVIKKMYKVCKML